MDKTDKVGILFPEILIPEDKINKKKWAVIACDQFTSNEEYWIKTAKTVGGSPSTLHIIVPEVFLNDDDIEGRISHAKETMGSYIEDGVLVRLPKGVVLVERETPFGTRVGIVLAIDLEKYDVDYTKKPLIRSTEQTVAERIPPRIKLREGAVLECPHAMLMLNDPGDSVIAPVYQARGNHTKIYDTPLMLDGGHMKGWFIDDQQILDGIVESLDKLKQNTKDGMLFAVGDGNHSLACAKEVWDKQKEEMSDEERQASPLRYALVEVVNLYDNGITIHPIHRVLFNVEVPGALRLLVSILNGMGTEARMMYTRGSKAYANQDMQMIFFESKMSKGRIELGKSKHDLLAVTLTKALDLLLKEMPRATIDYIHGDEELHELSKRHGCLGFMMEPMIKDQLFEAVIKYGVLPKKAFSLGNAHEKRYYYECRLLALEEEEQNEDGEIEQIETIQEVPQEKQSIDEITNDDVTGEQDDTRTLRRKKKFGRKRDNDDSM